MDGLPDLLPTLPGELLVDESWLADRIAQVGRQVGCAQPRINATLWWYSASAVLLGPAVHALVGSGAQVDLRPAALRVTLRPSGYLERVVVSARSGDDGDPGGDPGGDLGRHLDDALAQVINPLAEAGSATARSLWAIAVDSLATRVLAETAVTAGGTDQAPGIAASIARAAPRLRPLPRFEDVQGRPGGPVRRYVRRGSCCLLFRVPGGLCLSCPKQTPAERLARLRQHARTAG